MPLKNEGVREFLGTFDQTLNGSFDRERAQCAERNDLIPADVRQRLDETAQLVRETFMRSPWRIDNMQRLFERLESQVGITFPEEQIAIGNTGLYSRMHKLPPLREGERPGNLTFAILRAGRDQAPLHTHAADDSFGDPSLHTGWGELTLTMGGFLNYIDEETGDIHYTNASAKAVRRSAPGSLDAYIRQPALYDWVGAYVWNRPGKVVDLENPTPDDLEIITRAAKLALRNAARQNDEPRGGGAVQMIM